MTADPIVIDPPNFDQKAAWAECAEFVKECGGLAHEDGEPNYRAASGADPGVVACPCCREFHWAWGNVQRCTKCAFEYPTDWWPMFSWGASAGEGKGMRYKHAERMKHPYYNYGFHNPPKGDFYKAAVEIDWKTALKQGETHDDRSQERPGDDQTPGLPAAGQ